MSLPLPSLTAETPQDPLLNLPSSKPTLILHVGYPKTGTSSLQMGCFPYLEGVNYMGHYYIAYRAKGPSPFPPLPKDKIRADAYWWLYRNFVPISDESFEKTKREALFRIPRYLSNVSPNLYSHENFFHTGTCKPLLNHIQRLEALKEKFDLKIILTIRRQADLCLSRHLFVKQFWNKAPLPFEKTFLFEGQKHHEQTLKSTNAEPIVIDEGMDYLNVYKLFRRFLPSSHILVAPMEGMFDPKSDKWMKKILHFIKNRPLSAADEKVIHQFKNTPINQHSTPEALEEKKRFYASHYPRKIHALYAKSNQVLAKLCKVDLKTYGYC